MRELFVILVLLPLIGGIIQVPLVGFGDDYGAKIYFNLSIGTPPQTLPIQLLDDIFLPDLYLGDARTFNVGFNPDKSSTFVQLGDATTSYRKTGVNATDSVTFNSGITVQGKPVKVLYDFGKYLPNIGLMGIHRHQPIDTDCPKANGDCTSFVTSVVLAQKEPVLVLAFDKISPDFDNPFTGNIVFGEKPDKLCDSNWALMPEVKYKKYDFQQWAVEIDSITAGKYSFASPGNAVIELSDSELLLPTDIYNSILKALGSIDGYSIPCDTKTDIVFTLGGFDLDIKPETYIERFGEDVCGLRGVSIDNVSFEIPLSALTNHCLLYDYKNIQIGITKRI